VKGKTVAFDSYSDESKGIGIDHVLASVSIPIYNEYRVIRYQKYWGGTASTNTPLRELLQNHKDFWLKYSKENGIEIGEDQKVPDLDVYIVDSWP
jgi:hypothetical protein